MVEEAVDQRRQKFDRVMGTFHDLPDVKETRPTTVMQTVPILNETTTAVVQTYKSEEDGYFIFIQIVDSSGHMRIVLPDKVARAIYRQRDSLADRSTPDSRARRRAKRDREQLRGEKAARRAAWHAKHPDGGPLAKARK